MSQPLSVRYSSEDLDLLKRAALASNKKVAEFIRDASVSQARAVLGVPTLPFSERELSQKSYEIVLGLMQMMGLYMKSIGQEKLVAQASQLVKAQIALWQKQAGQ